MIYKYSSSIPCSCNYVNMVWVCTESNQLSTNATTSVFAWRNRREEKNVVDDDDDDDDNYRHGHCACIILLRRPTAKLPMTTT